jgi:hypothetical protein
MPAEGLFCRGFIPIFNSQLQRSRPPWKVPMPKQSFNSSSEPAKRAAPKKTYRTVKRPAVPGTVPEERIREAVRWVKQHRTVTKPA